MGNCCTKPEMQEFPSDLVYKNVVYLDITSVYGSQIGMLPSDNTYKLPGPVQQNNINAFLSNFPMKISGCILPGMDFRAGQTKVCQDDYAFIVHNNCLLAILCDGHGSEGHHIAKFSIEYMQKFFKKHFNKFRHDPKTVISTMLQKCDKKILSTLDSELSGATAVVLFIDSGILHCGSLGDSRAILGSISPVADIAKIKNQTKYVRKIVCERNFKATALTQDQKPESGDEMLRIRMSGGIVERYTDAFGRNVGPYRVWNRDGTGPGLAMSRSLGDKVAKGCGVISTPVMQDKVVAVGKDWYVVIASDGVWDVMDNIEVINFIDKYKRNCDNFSTDEYPGVITNCSISRLVCEEARYRWLGIAEQERVAIDDISCVIIDFGINEIRDSVVEEGEQKLVTLDGAKNFSEYDEA